MICPKIFGTSMGQTGQLLKDKVYKERYHDGYPATYATYATHELTNSRTHELTLLTNSRTYATHELTNLRYLRTYAT